MGLIADLLRDSPLKPEQLENIALVEKRMQDEKLTATRELERLKMEFERVRTELDQARSLVRVSPSGNRACRSCRKTIAGAPPIAPSLAHRA